MEKTRRWKSEWLWLAALLLLAALHVRFPDLRSGQSGDSFGTSPEGKKALFELSSTWFDTTRNFDAFEDVAAYLYDGDTLCLIGPARYPTRSEWKTLLECVAQGSVLLVAASSESDLELSIEELGLSVKPIDDADAAKWYEPKHADADGARSTLIDSDKLEWESERQIVAATTDLRWGAAEVLVEYEGTAQAVLRRHGEGKVIVVATDSIFSNMSLTNEDNAVLAFRLLEVGGGLSWILFDESLNVSGTPKIVGILLDPLLRPVTIQLLIVLLIFGWWSSLRFGPLLPVRHSTRHNIVDHTDAVGILQYKSRGGALSLASYLKQLTSELRLHLFKGREQRILEPIALRLGRSVESVRDELQQAASAALTPHLDRRTAAEMVRGLAVIRRAARPASRRRDDAQSAS